MLYNNDDDDNHVCIDFMCIVTTIGHYKFTIVILENDGSW